MAARHSISFTEEKRIHPDLECAQKPFRASGFVTNAQSGEVLFKSPKGANPERTSHERIVISSEWSLIHVSPVELHALGNSYSQTGDILNLIEMKILLLFIATALLASPQATRREIVNPAPTPEGDTHPNSDKVPDVYAVSGQFDRIVVLRFKFKTDLLGGMEKIVKQQKIRNAVILAGAGGVRGYHIHQVSNRDFPSKNTFEKDPDAPADLISMNGYIIDGKIHAHMTLANPDRAFGGHLEPGTEIFTFGIVTIGVMKEGADFTRLDDKTYR